jgi:glycosyltransferase involved in cell wall biosynthesis
MDIGSVTPETNEPRQIFAIVYACDPDAGSEPGAGWAWVRAAAKVAPVVALCARSARLSRARQEVELQRLDITFVPVGTPLDRLVPESNYIRYGLWTLRCIGILGRWSKVAAPGVVGHHLTYASDWLPSPLIGLKGIPFIWGPVGGSSKAPASLLRRLSIRAQIKEVIRAGVGAVSRSSLGRMTANRASMVVALNSDTARIYGDRRPIVEANAAVDYLELPERANAGRNIALVGRLVEWKGVHLALEAFADLRLSSWTLEVFGDGPEREKLVRTTAALGIEDRVTFHGRVSRQDVLRSVARCRGLLFMSLHDSAPWSVAEAAGIGLPVICFPQGGAREIAGRLALVLDPYNPIESVVSAILSLEGMPIRASIRDYSEERLERLLRSWYEQVLVKVQKDVGPRR